MRVDHLGTGKPQRMPTVLHPGCQLAPQVNPAELAALIRAFLAGSGRPRASGIKAQHAAAERLYGIARASVADALAIVTAEGLLRRVERNLAASSAGGALELRLACDSLDILMDSVESLDPAICARVAEERDLLRALVLLVARGSRARGNGSSADRSDRVSGLGDEG